MRMDMVIKIDIWVMIRKITVGVWAKTEVILIRKLKLKRKDLLIKC